MDQITAQEFQSACVRWLDEVASKRTPIVITKQGRPIAQLVPIPPLGNPVSLRDSIVHETGDPHATRALWEADRPERRSAVLQNGTSRASDAVAARRGRPVS